MSVFLVLAVAITAAAHASPAPAPSGHALRLVKLPNGDYTVPMSELAGSGTSGVVRLHPQGFKTLVTVTVGGRPRRHEFSLHSGHDCTESAAPRPVALAPALTGRPSRTLVSLPIGDFTSKDYVVTARDATKRAQFQEACARM